MSELIDCIDGLTAEDIIRSVAKTANGSPFYLQTSGLVGLGDELIINGQFLVDTSNWGPVQCTITRVVNFNGEPTSGQVEATGAGVQLRQTDISPPYIETGKSYRIETRAYIPSTNVTTDGYRVRFSGTSNQWGTGVITPPQDIWTTSIVEYTAVSLSERIYIYFYDGFAVGNATVGDDIYFALISVREIL